MRDADTHLGKARELLDEARYLLAGGFPAGAGRDAYLAGLHAALAFVVRQTGREPKTHRGARSEFARLARGEPRLAPDITGFLGRSYELKAWADYDAGEPITEDEARLALDAATRMVTVIAGLLAGS